MCFCYAVSEYVSQFLRNVKSKNYDNLKIFIPYVFEENENPILYML